MTDDDLATKLMRLAPAGIAVSRLSDGRLVLVSDHWSRMFGWPREKAIGRTSSELGMWPTPQGRAAMVDAVGRLGGLRDHELSLRRADGSAIDVLANADVIDHEGERCLLTISIDVTERKANQRAAARDVVQKALARTLLSALSRTGALDDRGRREVGRLIGGRVTDRDVAGLAETFRAIGLGDLHVIAEGPEHYEFEGDDLIEVVPGAGRATCTIVLGYLEGALATLTRERMLGAETRCRSLGHKSCSFVLLKRPE